MAISYTISYTFSPSTTISSSNVNQNFSDNKNTWDGIEAKTKTFSNLGVDTQLKSGGTIESADGAIGAPGLTFVADTDSGIYRIGANNIAISTNGTKALEISSAQAVILRGTATNDSAAAGFVGEIISASIVRSSATSISTNTGLSLTSISLTAGDWDVRAMGAIIATNAGTSIIYFSTSVSKTNNTEPGADTICVPTSGEVKVAQSMPASVIGNNNSFCVTTGPVLVSLASTTTIYLVVFGTFTVSTASAYGSIVARRVR